MSARDQMQNEVLTLYAITQAINSGLNQQEVLDVLLERIVTELDYKAATLRLLDVEHQQLTLKAAYGLSEDYLSKGNVEVLRSEIDRKVLSGKQVPIDDVRHATGFQYSDAAAKEGLTSMLALPLVVYDQAIGVLHVYTKVRQKSSPEEQAFLGAVANLGAQAIQRAHLFDSFRNIAHNINTSLELKEVLNTLLLSSVDTLNVKAGSIRLLGPTRQTLHLVAAYGLSKQYLQKGAVKVALSPIDQRVLEEGEPVILTDVTEETGFQYPEEARAEGIRSVFIIPLRVKEDVVGVLRMYSSKIRQFSPEEILYATAMADLGAVAIENAKLHEFLRQRLEALKEDLDGWYRYLAWS